MSRTRVNPVFQVLITVVFWVGLVPFPDQAGAASLEERLRRLKLGFKPYYLGQVLTPDEREAARKSLQPEAYAGTYKFRDKGVMVIVQEESHLVVGMYQQLEQAEPDAIRKAIVALMDEFGQPTTTGHDQVVYWAYGPQGKITDKQYRQAKKKGRIEILATVKFQSTAKFPDSEDQDQKESKASAYTLITSPPLMKRLIIKK